MIYDAMFSGVRPGDRDRFDSGNRIHPNLPKLGYAHFGQGNMTTAEVMQYLAARKGNGDMVLWTIDIEPASSNPSDVDTWDRACYKALFEIRGIDTTIPRGIFGVPSTAKYFPHPSNPTKHLLTIDTPQVYIYPGGFKA